MRNITLEEFWAVFKLSPATQMAIALAIIGPILVVAIGETAVPDFALSPPFVPLTAPIREFILDHYLEAAVVIAMGFGGVAVRSYRKARIRLLGCWE